MRQKTIEQYIHHVNICISLFCYCDRCRPHLEWALPMRRRLVTGGWMPLERQHTRRQAGFSSSSVSLFILAFCLIYSFLDVLGITISPFTSHPPLTLLFFSLFPASRPPPLPWKGPSSWVLDTLSATSAPSLREMCWCRTSMWWKASSSPGAFLCVDVYLRGHVCVQNLMFYLLLLFLFPSCSMQRRQ